MKKILVPTDFSEYADHALKAAIELNKKVQGKIVLMHVLELPAASVNYGGDMTAATAEVVYRRELIDRTSERLHNQAAEVEAADQSVSVRLEYGSPYKNIGKEVAEEKPDWVVMGSTGASGLEEVFLGSNAERVIRHSDCPVITVKGPTNFKNMKSMVFASDLSAEQDKVVRKASLLQDYFEMNMHVLRVKTPYNFLTTEEAKDQIKTFAERNALVDYSANVIEAEFAEDGIVSFAEEVGAGIIVMGTHGRTGLAHLFGGSRAEDVANHSKVPVMTVKI